MLTTALNRMQIGNDGSSGKVLLGDLAMLTLSRPYNIGC
jgi:hypothetical protein